MADWLKIILRQVSRIGADPADSAEVRLHKTMLTGISLSIIVLAVLWSGIYFVVGEPLAASIPLAYAVISSISIFIFSRTRRYRLFRSSQLLLMLMLPSVLMNVLGGFIDSGVVVVWSLLSPIGALVFSGLRAALRWFAAYIGLVILSGFLQTLEPASNKLAPALINIFFVINIGVVSAVVFAIIFYFIAQKDRAYDLLRVEQEKSDNLLLNVLPKEIAAVLKHEQRTIATSYDDASILFADIVGFTTLSTQMSPEEMIDLLNEIFSHFDSLVEKYGLEKIRTIGDNYMVASGVPVERPDHCQALARFALDMCDYMNRRPAYKGHQVQFRIGMNSGPMIGGVIGQQKFHYDVWGDTVNTASRMESQGVAQKIQITQACYQKLKDEFVCEPRGSIDVKGKGEMVAWFLVGEKAHSI